MMAAYVPKTNRKMPWIVTWPTDMYMQVIANSTKTETVMWNDCRLKTWKPDSPGGSKTDSVNHQGTQSQEGQAEQDLCTKPGELARRLPSKGDNPQRWYHIGDVGLRLISQIGKILKIPWFLMVSYGFLNFLTFLVAWKSENLKTATEVQSRRPQWSPTSLLEEIRDSLTSWGNGSWGNGSWRNLAPVDMVAFPIIYVRFFLHPRWLFRIYSSISMYHVTGSWGKLVSGMFQVHVLCTVNSSSLGIGRPPLWLRWSHEGLWWPLQSGSPVPQNLTHFVKIRAEGAALPKVSVPAASP